MPPGSLPPPYASPAYNPPQYLLTSTFLSRDQLISHYEAFCQSLRHVEAAPELVFERLVSNLIAPLHDALVHSVVISVADKEAWRREKAALESALDSATTAKNDAERRLRNYSITAVPATPVVIPAVTSSSRQIYLQFWFSFPPARSSSSYDKKYTRVHGATTTAATPYGIFSDWPATGHLDKSSDHGCYDTRMDKRLVSSTLPSTVTKVIRFKVPFESPPTVLVWLTGLSATRRAAVSVNASANNITETEFSLQISSGGGAPLTSAGAAWAVCDARTLFQAGSFSTVKPGGERISKLDERGSLMRSIVSKIGLFGVSAVDLVLGADGWIDVLINDEGVRCTWEFKAGPVSAKVYSARVAYVGHLG